MLWATTAFAQSEMTINCSEPGQLSDKIGGRYEYLNRLTVTGRLGSSDIETLRCLASRDKYKTISDGKEVWKDNFFELDISGVSCAPNNIMFPRASHLVKIILPVNARRIPDNAFYGCSRLIHFIAPPLISIGNSSFEGCKNLEKFFIPKTMEHWGTNCFKDCTGLTDILIPEGLKDLPEGCLSGTKITSAYIPSTIMSIHETAFDDCNALKSFGVDSYNPNFMVAGPLLIDKNSMTIVGAARAARGAVNVPEGVTKLRNKTFNSWWFDSINLPTTIQNIEPGTFKWCGFSTIAWPDNVKEIPDGVFECSGLKDFKIPEGVTRIGNHAFHASTLTSIEIPASVTTLGESCFQKCNFTEFTLPSTVTTFGDAILKNSDITKINLPDNLKYISNEMLRDTHLTELVIPSGVTKIGDHAFQSIKELKTITIPASVTEYGKKMLYGCKNLESVIVMNENPTDVENIYNEKKAVLRVPKGCVEKYKACKGWKKFKNIEEQ